MEEVDIPKHFVLTCRICQTAIVSTSSDTIWLYDAHLSKDLHFSRTPDIESCDSLRFHDVLYIDFSEYSYLEEHFRNQVQESIQERKCGSALACVCNHTIGYVRVPDTIYCSCRQYHLPAIEFYRSDMHITELGTLSTYGLHEGHSHHQPDDF